ncbi:hypothetical protein [Leptospira paudalimensis]|uniref:Lipoprotein n=1 Tax=Leptospira paudalimensis TaxID=2950024 RepID=A0ABT3M6V3_9LEPT|nr:hypothetical protein [Leptospira paudalimensis]MCW7504108.1 hypothetical protein [Leptospira paudalimensis]
MKIRSFPLYLLVFSLNVCQTIQTNDPERFQSKESKSSFTLQYEMDLPTTVLKVGPNLEISIGKFALHSFNRLASQIFNVSSYKARKENDPIEPGTIILRKVQVNRSMVFEEGTTKFQHATFASIVEFLFVKESGETYRILGQSDPIQTDTIPFSANDKDSEEKIASTIQSAIEIGLKKIIQPREDWKWDGRQMMFQQGNGN